MIALWVLYVSALSLCFGLAAFALERAAGLWARPRRVVWAAAIGASLLVPVAGLVIPGVPLPRRAAPGSLLIEALVVGPAPAEQAQSADAPPAQNRIRPLLAVLNRPLLLLWGGASLALALGLIRAGTRLRRRARAWRASVVDGTEVLVAPDIGPAVVRLGGLKIVLPEWALAAEPAARSLMLLHENEHREARDPDLLLGATVALMLVPWALPLWWQVRRLQLAVETDCDRRVMHAGADAHSYGVLLLSVGVRSARQPLLAPTAFSEERSFLERRIEAMTSPNAKRRLVRTALATGAGVLGVAVAFMMPHPAPAAAQQRQAVYAEDSASVRPERIGGPSIRYPDSLRSAGIGGRVLVEAIIDTTGHAEPASVQILESAHPGLDAPAREAVVASTYLPGRIDGRAVRVRVRIPVNFQVEQVSASDYRLSPASNVFLRDGVAALRAQDYARADSLFRLAQQGTSGQELQAAMFFVGVTQFQRGYAALRDAQSKFRGAETDPAVKAAACASVASAGTFLNQAEQNITGGAASNRERATQLLNYLPPMKNDVQQLARGLNCPS